MSGLLPRAAHSTPAWLRSATRSPPEKPIVVEWPDAVYVDGGLVGGGRLAWPEHADEHAVPDWLVFGAAIRTFSLSPERSGLHPLSTALADESFDDVSSERLAEGFARHLMVAIDRWQEAGFAPIAKEYIAKLKPGSGVHRDISENGDLDARRSGELVERRELVPALKAAVMARPEDRRTPAMKARTVRQWAKWKEDHRA